MRQYAVLIYPFPGISFRLLPEKEPAELWEEMGLTRETEIEMRLRNEEKGVGGNE